MCTDIQFEIACLGFALVPPTLLVGLLLETFSEGYLYLFPDTSEPGLQLMVLSNPGKTLKNAHIW